MNDVANRFRRTKILATVGPATSSPETIEAMVVAGVSGFRLNFSHGTNEERDQQIPLIREAAAKHGRLVTIVQDLQGPKIRLGDFEGTIPVHKGQELRLTYGAEYDGGNVIPVQYDISQKMKVHERLFMFDGRVRTTVIGIEPGVVVARVENDGVIMKRKGLNLPDTDFGGDILTEKDLRDIAYGADKDFDYVAISFIQTAADVEKFKAALAQAGHTQAKLITKIETPSAIREENLEAIVQASDGVMVARGDLAVETSPEVVPTVQRQILALAQKHNKIAIVATQMLISMTDSPEPTRAEVSDVANAVYSGTDAVMLSDETATGKFPLEAIGTMARVISYTEEHMTSIALPLPDRTLRHNRQLAIAVGIISLADTIRAKAIVAETKSGATALQIACRRPNIPLIAVTSEIRTGQQLALVYGVRSYVRPVDAHAAFKLTDWLQGQQFLEKGDIVVTASGRYPGVVGTTDTIKVRVLE